MEDVLAPAALLLSTAVLSSAAVSDWRRREASDIHWIVMMAAGTVLFCIRIADEGCPAAACLMPVSMALMCADLVWDRDPGAGWDMPLYTAVIITSLVPSIMLWDSPVVRSYLSIPAMYVLMNVLYYSGIVKGGADAKSVISIAFLFPSYPETGCTPLVAVPDGILSQVIVPSFSVFFLASVMTVFLCIPYAVVNICRGDIRFPVMLAGVRMPVGSLSSSHVWPMEDVVDGERVVRISGFDDPDTPRRLEEAGAESVWVTPVIPFLIPVAVSSVVVLVLGNPLFLIA